MLASDELPPMFRDLYAYIFERRTDKTKEPLASSLYELAKTAANFKSDAGETRSLLTLYQAFHKVWAYKTINRKLSVPTLSILRNAITEEIKKTSDIPEKELQRFYQIYRKTLLTAHPDDGSLGWLLTTKPLDPSGRTLIKDNKGLASLMIKTSEDRIPKAEKDDLRNALTSGLANPAAAYFEPLGSYYVEKIISFIQKTAKGLGKKYLIEFCQEIRARAKELEDLNTPEPAQDERALREDFLAKAGPPDALPFWIPRRSERYPSKFSSYGDTLLGKETPFSDLDDLFNHIQQAEKLCRIPPCIKKEILQKICHTPDYLPNDRQHRVIVEALGLKTKYKAPYKLIKEHLHNIRKEESVRIRFDLRSTDIDPRFTELYAYLFEKNIDQTSASLMTTTDHLIEKMEHFEDGDGNKRAYLNLRHALYGAWNPESTAGLSNSLLVLLRNTVESLIRERAPNPEKELNRFYKIYGETIQRQTPDDGSLRWFLTKKTFGPRHDFLANNVLGCAQEAIPNATDWGVHRIKRGVTLPHKSSYRPLDEKYLQAIEELISKRAKEIEGVSPDEILREFKERVKMVRAQEEEIKVPKRESIRAITRSTGPAVAATL